MRAVAGANQGGGSLGRPSAQGYERTPAPIPGLSGIAHIGSGYQHGLAVTSSGVVSSWGSNSQGQLGDGLLLTASADPVAISDAGCDWRVARPRLSVGSGTYFNTFSVTVLNATDGSSMHYTVDGAEPTESDPTVPSGGTITITQSTVLRITAWKAGAPPSAVSAATYVMKVALPSFSPGPTTYTAPQSWRWPRETITASRCAATAASWPGA